MNVMDANPRLALLFLAKAGEMAGSPISRYFSPDEAAWVMHQLRTLSTGSVDSVESETQALRADRSTVWLAWSASAVRKANGENYYIAMFEDRTTKHQAEVAAARNLNVLERLSRLKTEFLTTVSHELRTALVGIQGFSELIRDAESLDVDEVKSFADEVYREARRLDQMLDKMLELDRAPGSRTIPHITEINLNTVVHDSVAAAGAEAHRHHVAANLELVLPTVKGDAAMLRQVLSILLSNAFKYSPEGSEVVVSSRVEPGYVQISVKDHGLGMPADFDEQLFGRHQRNADNPASEVAGSGLGLPIARQIVELHGGRIWFETAAGVGSEFHFTIPTPARPTARSETL
jgi:PAS domain S-box-containing protein